jgi:hypothetical protein
MKYRTRARSNRMRVKKSPRRDYHERVTPIAIEGSKRAGVRSYTADEELIVSSAITAIMTGQATMILTREPRGTRWRGNQRSNLVYYYRPMLGSKFSPVANNWSNDVAHLQSAGKVFERNLRCPFLFSSSSVAHRSPTPCIRSQSWSPRTVLNAAGRASNWPPATTLECESRHSFVQCDSCGCIVGVIPNAAPGPDQSCEEFTAPASISDALKENFEELDSRATSGKLRMNGIPTGYSDLDNITAGLQNSELIIIAGRPAVGKTVFALNLVRNIVVDRNVRVLYFSLVESRSQIAERLL